MKIDIQKKNLLSFQDQTLVLFIPQKSSSKTSKKEATLNLASLPKEIVNFINSAQKETDFEGKSKETRLFRQTQLGSFENVLLIGLGQEKKISLESLRVAAATAEKSLESNKLKSATFFVDNLTKYVKKATNAAHALTEGVLLSAYQFDKFFSEKPKPHFQKMTFLTQSAPPTTLKKAVTQAQALCECVNFARYLGDMPGNLLTPKDLARETVNAAKGTGLKVTVWNKERIKKEKMGGLYGVSLGSAAEPRFIIMEYKGASKSQKPICFVGKGLTFDSGGISIKPSQSMDEMKYDMCGGAAVIGAMLAIAKLKLKVNAIGLVPASENMPGPLANKPGDILRARNGKTVEVLNTDAEGRLILMDALCYASELKPRAILDAATLTGAIIVALGNSYTGVFSKNEKLVKTIKEAAEHTGENVWHMPLCDDFTQDMKGTHADLSNISSFRGAGSSTAAAFLEQFVDPEIPWAHLDIAGTAWNIANRKNYCPKKGASGVMVRTFVELAQRL
ncbi:MAG: leucyl aminopeptidase [Bdellovibrio sp.]|nr:MAG: leucyl aminopeptidase [Bdellovibrio sp.]